MILNKASKAAIDKVLKNSKDEEGFNPLNQHLRVYMIVKKDKFILMGLNLDHNGHDPGHNTLNTVTASFSVEKQSLEFDMGTHQIFYAL